MTQIFASLAVGDAAYLVGVAGITDNVVLALTGSDELHLQFVNLALQLALFGGEEAAGLTACTLVLVEVACAVLTEHLHLDVVDALHLTASHRVGKVSHSVFILSDFNGFVVHFRKALKVKTCGNKKEFRSPLLSTLNEAAVPLSDREGRNSNPL